MENTPNTIALPSDIESVATKQATPDFTYLNSPLNQEQMVTVEPVVKMIQQKVATKQKVNSSLSGNGGGVDDISFSSVNNRDVDRRIKTFDSTTPFNDVYKQFGDGEVVKRYDTFMPGIDNAEYAAKNQSTSDKWINGLTKAAVNFGTTVAGNTVGLLYGIGNGVAEGSLNAVFDNKFTNYVADLNDKLGYKLANYVSKDEQDDNFFESMGTANFWAKDVAGAFSFTLGTAVSEAIWAVATGGAGNAARAALRATEAKNVALGLFKVERSMAGLSAAKKIVAQASKTLFTGATDDVLRAGVSASNWSKAANTGRFLLTTSGNEAGIEALHYKRESRENFYDKFEKQNGRPPSADEVNQFEDKLGNSANAVFATNMAILMPSNLAMFGSAFNIASPFRGMAKGANKTLFGIGTELVEEGGEKVFKGIVASGAQKAARYSYAALKPLLTEGLYEEGLQGVTTNVAKQWMESTYDPKYTNQTIALADATYKAFGEQYGTKEGWKEIGIGGIVGGVSSVVSGKGNFQEIAEFNQQQEYQDKYVADGMNKFGDNTTQASRNMVQQFMMDAKTRGAIERQVKAAKEGDDVGYALADQDKLVAEMQFRKAIGEDPKELISKYETALNSMPKEEFEKVGITDIDAYKSNVLRGYSSLIESHEKASNFADAIIGGTGIMGIDSKTMETQQLKDGLTRAIVSGQLANKVMDSILQDMGAIIGKDTMKAQTIQDEMSRLGKNTQSRVRTLNKSIEQADKERVILSAELEKLQIAKDENKAQRLLTVQTKLTQNLEKSVDLKSQREELARDVSQESKRRRGINSTNTDTTNKNTLLNEYITGEDLANLDKNLQKIEDTIKSYEGVNHEVYYDLLESKRQYGLAKDRFMGYQDAIDGIVSGNFKPNYAKVSPFWQKVFMQKQGIDDFSKAYLENILENYKNFGDGLGVEDVTLEMGITEEDYRIFQETGDISDEIKQNIAQTIKDKGELSKRAKEIYDANYDEINNLNKVKVNPNKPDLSPEASIDKEIEALEKEKASLLKVKQNTSVDVVFTEEKNIVDKPLLSKLEKLPIKSENQQAFDNANLIIESIDFNDEQSIKEGIASLANTVSGKDISQTKTTSESYIRGKEKLIGSDNFKTKEYLKSYINILYRDFTGKDDFFSEKEKAPKIEIDLEAKKADVEKRRREELEKKDVHYLLPVGIDLNVFENKELLQRKNSQDEINAKYDKELKTLKEKANSKEVVNSSEIQVIYNKLDKLKETFLKNGKSDKESDSLALASLTGVEKQILRDSYNTGIKTTTTLNPTITKIEDGELYEFATPLGVMAGVMVSPTEFRIDGISASDVGKGQGFELFKNLIYFLKSKGVENITTKSAGEGAKKMHQKAVDAGLISRISEDGRNATFSINKTQEVTKQTQEKINKIDKQIQTLQAKKRGTLTEAENVRQQAEAIMERDFPLITYDLEELISNQPTETELKKYQELYAKKDKLNLFESTEFEKLQPKMQKWFTAESLPSLGGMSLAEVVEYLAQLETQSEKENTLVESSFEAMLNKEDAVDLVNEKILQNMAGSATTKIVKNGDTTKIFFSGLNVKTIIDRLVKNGITKAEIKVVVKDKEGKEKLLKKDLTDVLLNENTKLLTVGTEFLIGDTKIVIGARGNLVMDLEQYNKVKDVINVHYFNAQTGSWSWTDAYEEIESVGKIKIKSSYNSNTNSDKIYDLESGDDLQFFVDMNTDFNYQLKLEALEEISNNNELSKELKNKILKSLEITAKSGNDSISTLKATGEKVTDDNFMLLRKRYADEFFRILEEQKDLATLPTKINLKIEAPISEIFLGTPDFILDNTNTPKELEITEVGLTKVLSQGYVQDKEIVLADKKVNIDKVTRLYVSNLAKKNPGVKIPIVLLKKGTHLFVFPINLIQTPNNQEAKFQAILDSGENFNEIRRNINNLLISLASNTRLTADSDIQFENIREELKNQKTNIPAEQLANADYDKINLINDATSKIDFENTLISSPKITVDFSKAIFGIKSEAETNAANIRQEIVKDLLEIRNIVNSNPDLNDDTRFVKAFAENDVKNQGSDIMNRSDINFISKAFFNETGKIAINVNDKAVIAIGKDKLLAFRKKLENLIWHEDQIKIQNSKEAENNIKCK